MADAADTFEFEPLREVNAGAGTASEPEEGTLSADEIGRLLALRHRVETGDVHEWSGDYKRLRFARWLYEQGKLES